jgi:hypothetical protein
MVKKTRKLKFSQQIFMIVLILVGSAFIPITIVLVIGMLPSFVAFLVDTSRDKTRALTVSLMNFVSVFPFLLMVAMDHYSMDGAVTILTQILNPVIMYAGAAAGYFLDWTFAGVSNIVMTARAKQRLEAIRKRQEELVRRWGREVTGDTPLDPDGFPMVDEDDRG